MNNYYKNQLDQLKQGDYPMSVKLFDGEGSSTKTMDLNSESIPVLVEYLLGVRAELMEKKHHE